MADRVKKISTQVANMAARVFLEELNEKSMQKWYSNLVGVEQTKNLQVDLIKELLVLLGFDDTWREHVRLVQTQRHVYLSVQDGFDLEQGVQRRMSYLLSLLGWKVYDNVDATLSDAEYKEILLNAFFRYASLRVDEVLDAEGVKTGQFSCGSSNDAIFYFFVKDLVNHESFVGFFDEVLEEVKTIQSTRSINMGRLKKLKHAV